MSKTLMNKKREDITWEEFIKRFEFVYKSTIEEKNYNQFVSFDWYTKEVNSEGKEYWGENDTLLCEMCDGWMAITLFTYEEDDDDEDRYYYINRECETPDEIIKYPTSPYPFAYPMKLLTRDKEYVLNLFNRFYHDVDSTIQEIKETFL